jgi:hypothetical protein
MRKFQIRKCARLPAITCGGGLRIAGTTGEALVHILRAERERWGPIVKASGFKAEQ